MKRKAKYIREVWVKPQGELALVEWNLCRCHPNDVIMTWGPKMQDSAWYGVQNKTSWTKNLRSRNWMRLERQILD